MITTVVLTVSSVIICNVWTLHEKLDELTDRLRLGWEKGEKKEDNLCIVMILSSNQS